MEDKGEGLHSYLHLHPHLQSISLILFELIIDVLCWLLIELEFVVIIVDGRFYKGFVYERFVCLLIDRVGLRINSQNDKSRIFGHVFDVVTID